MTLTLLIRKLYTIDERYIGRKRLETYCKELGINYYTAIMYLLRHKYLIRILKGVFYKPSIEERKLDRIDADPLEAIGHAMDMKGIDNWYFGLESALKLNNMTHEFFTTEYVINDTMFRPKPFAILGRKVKFIKVKKPLTGFGILKKGYIRYSDPEKTITDMIYLARYSGVSEKEINSRIHDLLDVSDERLKKYAHKYNISMAGFVETL
jgi:hypothetical protein